ncbi:hypothetical protein B0O99DRAFT_508561, partial [Bisporella sp. PMI_857]
LAFRALRATGLALSLAVTAIAGYQALQDARMAEPASRPTHGRLDATGSREVVFCHSCETEWYRDDHNDQITPDESDPRPINAPLPTQTPPGFRSIRNHNPWDDAPDPEEADIEEHIRHGPAGSIFITRTIRSSGPAGVSFGGRARRGPGQDDTPEMLTRSFQDMLATIMGPSLRNGQAGRSGSDDLFPPLPGRAGGGGPTVFGGRYTFTTGSINPQRNGDREVDGDDPARLLSALFGLMVPQGQGPNNGMPGGLQGLFASLLDPANARHGDAVYSQEALDRIISQMMEAHPTSNAPGPATAEAIAALTKEKLNEKMLPEGKGECTVCMDDVHIGDEVVVLPCTHWFHEACASAWLREHNTCPICRKGIDEDVATSSNSNSREPSQPQSPAQPNWSTHPSHTRTGSSGQEARNQARLDRIRNLGQPADESQQAEDDTWQMPGAYNRHYSDTSRDNVRRADTSGSDHSRHSQRSNGSGNGGTINSAMNWMRDRLGGNGNNNNQNRRN